MSLKSSSLAMKPTKQEKAEEHTPKLEVLVKSRNGFVKCPDASDTQDDVILIGGRITVSF